MERLFLCDSRLPNLGTDRLLLLESRARREHVESTAIEAPVSSRTPTSHMTFSRPSPADSSYQICFAHTIPLSKPAFPVRRFSTSSKSFPTCTATNAAKKSARRSLDRLPSPTFSEVVRKNAPHNFPLTRRMPKTLQINIGLTCNMACAHCHVESSPYRSESMSSLVADRLLHLTENTPSIQVADITGGAPEMHSQFRPLVRAFRNMGISVIDRCNLTVLLREDQSDLVQFMAENQVRVIASLPCYTPQNVEKQRGTGVFDASVDALRRLNEAGYGRDPSLTLDLVYNSVGATLPPPQATLEVHYKRELKRAFGIDFTSLICITNMPIKRFADDLLAHGRLEQYVDLLVNSFNAQNVDNVMCLDMVHVAYDGSFYDCDFNYALDMYLPAPNGNSCVRKTKGLNVFDVDSFAELHAREIRTGAHCFGCTAGSGSSCGGNLS